MSGKLEKGSKAPSTRPSKGAAPAATPKTTSRRVSREGGDEGHPRRRRSSKGTQSGGGKGGGGAEGPSKDVYFLIPRSVTILYGPYQWKGMMDYRTERLQGLKTFLEKLGVTVTLTPCLDHVNLCRLWFLDEVIWDCKITELMVGGDGELDPLCWEAADKLEGMVKEVLRGLKTMKGMPTVEQLKKPFCPCFQVDWQGGKGKGSGGGKKGRGKSLEGQVGEEKCLACRAVGGAGKGGGGGRLSVKSKEEDDKQQDKQSDSDDDDDKPWNEEIDD